MKYFLKRLTLVTLVAAMALTLITSPSMAEKEPLIVSHHKINHCNQPRNYEPIAQSATQITVMS